MFYQPDLLDQAYDWLCKRRKDYHFHSDVWHLRSHWATEKENLLQELRQETYRFDAVTVYNLPDKKIGIWSAKDALVLKMLALYLRKALDPILSDRIYHLCAIDEQEKRGNQAAVRKVLDALPDNEFVFRTDVKGYYASIQHSVLFGLCQQYIQDSFILKLIKQYLRHHTYDDGIYRSIQTGISLGCPLSPLMGALCLKPLDDAMEKTDLFYLRFMDDWVVLSPTRWKLRKAIATVNQCLNDLHFEKHPDKTFIGRTDKGFDFLGVHFQTVPIANNSTVAAPVESDCPLRCLPSDVLATLNLPTTVLSAVKKMDSTDLAVIKAPPSSEIKAVAPTAPIVPKSASTESKKTVQLTIAQKTIDNFLTKISQLYEHGASLERIGKYVRKWIVWVDRFLGSSVRW